MSKTFLFNTTTGEQVAEVTLAKSISSRLVGLLRHKKLEEHKTLWLLPCPSIHTFFMKFSIDAVFVDKKMTVTNVHVNVKPWRMTPILKFKNHSCFEFAAFASQNKIKKGDKLNVQA